MWSVVQGPELVVPLADHRRLRFVVERGEEAREIFVEISGTAAACDPYALPYPVSAAVRTDGLSAVEHYLAEGDPPAIIEVGTNGIWSSIVPTCSGL
jgi:hypothetical protein